MPKKTATKKNKKSDTLSIPVTFGDEEGEKEQQQSTPMEEEVTNGNESDRKGQKAKLTKEEIEKLTPEQKLKREIRNKYLKVHRARNRIFEDIQHIGDLGVNSFCVVQTQGKCSLTAHGSRLFENILEQKFTTKRKIANAREETIFIKDDEFDLRSLLASVFKRYEMQSTKKTSTPKKSPKTKTTTIINNTKNNSNNNNKKKKKTGRPKKIQIDFTSPVPSDSEETDKSPVIIRNGDEYKIGGSEEEEREKDDDNDEEEEEEEDDEEEEEQLNGKNRDDISDESGEEEHESDD